jgi:hypothetical protein
MGKKAQEVIEHPDPLFRTGQNCWGSKGLGGDISIALECAEDERLLTTDRSFDVICPAVGLQPPIRIDGTTTP